VAVRTTRIYCRPTCRPGRAPKPENCTPFPDAASARAAGYRPCKQCRPDGDRPGSQPAVEPISYGVGSTTLGTAFVAQTSQGVCALFLLDSDDLGPSLARLQKLVPAGELAERDDVVAPILDWIRLYLANPQCGDEPPLDLRGTPFQLRVWERLRAIPSGSTATYGGLALDLGQPGASRAVGTACGANPVSLLVPCHRVLSSNGALGGYRWGLERKRALLDLERDKLRCFT
jgi:O-6-methylguanine DNA methyltransferase